MISPWFIILDDSRIVNQSLTWLNICMKIKYIYIYIYIFIYIYTSGLAEKPEIYLKHLEDLECLLGCLKYGS